MNNHLIALPAPSDLSGAVLVGPLSRFSSDDTNYFPFNIYKTADRVIFGIGEIPEFQETGYVLRADDESFSETLDYLVQGLDGLYGEIPSNMPEALKQWGIIADASKFPTLPEIAAVEAAAYEDERKEQNDLIRMEFLHEDGPYFGPAAMNSDLERLRAFAPDGSERWEAFKAARAVCQEFVNAWEDVPLADD